MRTFAANGAAFSGRATPQFETCPRRRSGGCYYRQRDYRSTDGRYASDLSLLNVGNIRVDGMEFRPSIQVTDSLYELRAAGFDDAVVHLRQDGRVWVTR